MKKITRTYYTHKKNYLIDCTCEPLEDSFNVAAILHRNAPHVILLVDPDQESFGLVVEDTFSHMHRRILVSN